jgi:serine/threonine protein kinase
MFHNWKVAYRTLQSRRFQDALRLAGVVGASTAAVITSQSCKYTGFDSAVSRNVSLCQELNEDSGIPGDFEFQDDPSLPEVKEPNGSNNKTERVLSSSSFKIQDFYDIQRVLGEGTYGLVYQARRKLDGALVALKSMPRALTGKTDFEREVAALQLLSKPPGHPHVVKFYDLHRDNSHYYLALELVEGGELLEHLIENGPYSEALAASFLRQFAEALCFVHTSGLSHADLKPENLLLSSNDMNKAKLIIADFGSARSHDLSRKEMHLPMAEFAIGCSFLHLTALGNQFELEKMLQERPGLVNFRDYDFRTPLHLAASEGHVDICRFLVEKGARVNRADRWGGTPLDDAHRSRHRDVIEYLRKNGATFGTKTQLPRFIQSAAEGDTDELKALLEFGNIDVDEGDYDRRTALHLAAGEGRLETVELLCQAGANPNVEDRWQNRPLDDARNAKKNANAIMSILVKSGARSLKDPNLHREIKETYIQITSKSPSASYNTARKKEKQAESFSGTIAYWPPELFKEGAQPSPSTDMWAAGMIMYVLLTGT